MLLIRLFDRIQYKSKGRLYLIFLTGLTGFGSLGSAPRLNELFASEDGPRAILSIALILLSVLAFIDILINDFLPEKFVLKSTLRWRHMIYAGIAICYCIAALQAGIYGSPVFLMFFAGSVIAAFVAGFGDIFKRFSPANVKN